jgi:exodeoxyribonuclease V beta subunit
VIEKRLTFPYQKERIDLLLQAELKSSPFLPHEREIATLIEAAFKAPLPSPHGTFRLEEIPPDQLYPEVEFFHPSSPHEIMKGFIDLVFLHQGNYYLLDWKSNFLEGYDKSHLEKAMQENDYFRQAEIYEEALTRYLTFKKAKERIEGTFYLFLRGLPEGEGVLFLNPKSSTPSVHPHSRSTLVH